LLFICFPTKAVGTQVVNHPIPLHFFHEKFPGSLGGGIKIFYADLGIAVNALIKALVTAKFPGLPEAAVGIHIIRLKIASDFIGPGNQVTVA
jgi:hypothetical protein